MVMAMLMLAWVANMEEYLTSRAESGLPISGNKLVSGRGSRSWIDQAAAEAALSMLYGSAVFNTPEPTFKSPNQIEQLPGLDKVSIRDLWIKTPGRSKLVPNSDPREAVKPSAVEDFGVYIDLSSLGM